MYKRQALVVLVAVISTDDDTMLLSEDPSKFGRVPVSSEAGKLVSLLPLPENPVAVRIPALESNVKAVLDFTACEPEGLVANMILQSVSIVSAAISTSEEEPVREPTNDV